MAKKIIKELKKTLKKEQLEKALQELKALEGEFIYLHSLKTAFILKQMGAKPETVLAGMLHHLPKSKLPKEAVPIFQKLKQLEEIFDLKQELKQKPIKKWHEVMLNAQAENLRKMIFALTQDLNPVFVLLANRLDEMRSLRHFPQQERIKKSLEALEIFAPLSYSIGALKIKGELEDLAFPYLYPKEYDWLVSKVKEEYKEMEKRLEKTTPLLIKALKKEKIEFLDISSRAKHYFSLYQKLLRHNMDIEKIYDLVALRIIVPNLETCYKTLGAVHKLWRPLEGRIKDYISAPKKNGYRALHTTVLCPSPLEIQIKTPLMNREAEYGVCAHLGYKTGQQPYWMNKLRKWKEEIKNPKQISEYLKSEIFKNRIFVLTPKREVIDLPKDACPVDFAYAIHTDIGEHCEGAKINGKMTSLKKSLKTGDVVEIITNKHKLPSSDWLRFVKTKRARNKIRDYLERTQGMSFRKKQKKLSLKQGISILKKIIPKKKKKDEIFIAGQTGISINLSKCCSPNSGDEIQAFVTKGRGASVHKKACKNLKDLKEKYPQRVLDAKWGKA